MEAFWINFILGCLGLLIIICIIAIAKLMLFTDLTSEKSFEELTRRKR